MKTFKPRLEILPEAQYALWPELARVPRKFVLYGGTAVALYLGHRQSVDFDFFCADPLQKEELFGQLPFLQNATIIQEEQDSLTVLVTGGESVKLSFFGGLTMGRLEEPLLSQDNVLLVASKIDLLGCKLAVLQKRVESKDYQDIAALLKYDCNLSLGLAAARALYPRFSPILGLKALTYFKGGDLETLDAEIRNVLLNAASTVSEPLPVLKAEKPIGR